MVKRVIVITGTPCVGKTTIARLLAHKINASYINLTELAVKEGIILGVDEKRGSMIVDEEKMKKRIKEIVESATEENIVVDGHYAQHVVPDEITMHVLVLRRDPEELQKLMIKAGYSGNKLWENLAAEILDVCLVEALHAYSKDKICELNVTSRSPEDVVNEILEVIKGSRKCSIGIVDWLGKLEMEGKLEEYLKI
ncbi:MAG: adenylate kinase family protein [Candidatus Bathyarchaeia archaeon]|nr:adenylate kinase family protein [Candidatus Bathyarchaeota archaeon]